MPDTTILLGELQDLYILMCILSLHYIISSMVSVILHARVSLFYPVID